MKKELEQFKLISGQMKNLARSGWLYHKIQSPEVDASHSWSVSMLVQLYAPKELDLCKCLKMANIHDLAEIYVGDYTPGSGISPQEKYDLESKAMRRLADELQYPELIELFEEFEACETPEAVFVKNMDRLDTVIQAKYFDETQNYGGKLFAEFYDFALTRITHPLVLDLLKSLKN